LNPSHVPISVAIPTFLREHVLLQTIEYLLGQDTKPDEILVIDQTPHHEPQTEDQLQRWNSDGQIRWIRLDKPSIPAAMNRALICAKQDIVLFLDDDIVPHSELIAAHVKNYSDPLIWGVAGQVLQPGQQPVDAEAVAQNTSVSAGSFLFNGTRKQLIRDCIAANFSVRREKAFMIGGFDENFIGDAYRFETEFCRRLSRNGGNINFEPEASVRHLQIKNGGTRSYGSHMTSARPDLTSGEYYFVLSEYSGIARVRYILYRLMRSLGRKFYLFHPWWLPVKLYAEIRGLLLAAKLKRRGPAYIQRTQTDTA
jgi:glycosyltransferase involved in cell wall biosynthesis